MLAGHYATALVAQQRAPSNRLPAYPLAWYLAVSQLPDLLWQSVFSGNLAGCCLPNLLDERRLLNTSVPLRTKCLYGGQFSHINIADAMSVYGDPANNYTDQHWAQSCC